MRLFAVTLFILQAIGWGLFQDSGPGSGNGPTIFSQLPISGGGFVISGPDINNDGTHGTVILTGSDVYGCEKWNAGTSSWKPLATINNGSGVGILSGNGAAGCWFVVSSPSNTNYIAMMLGNGELYRSTDGGNTFADTGFNSASNPNAGGNRLFGPRAAFDPINSDVLYIGTGAAGVYSTSNFTTATPTNISFSAVASIPTVSSNNGYAIAFDKNGGTTSGKTNIVYVNPFGSQIYQATTPLGSFSAVTGGPTTVARMAVDPNGTIWAADGTNADKGTGCRSGGGSCSWAAQSTGLGSPLAVAVDPNNCSSGATCHVVFIGSDSSAGGISATANGGTSWLENLSHSRSASDSPWLAETNEFSMSIAGIQFDNTGLLWFAEGIGVWTTTPVYAPSSAVNTVWTSATKGIANLDANGVLSPPSVGNRAVTWQWDRGTFTSDTVHEPSTQGPNVLHSIEAGWAMDVASSDGTTLAMVGNFVGFDDSSISNNAGSTWIPFPSSTVGQVSLTTTATTAVGNGVLTFSSVPGTVRANMIVADVTTPSAISPDSRVIEGGVVGNQVIFNTSTAGGAAGTVGNGDTITFSYASSPYSRPLVTNGSTSSGVVLHFASVPSWVHLGMAPAGASGCIASGGGSPAQVIATTSTTVSITQNVTCTVNSGETIIFQESAGGAIAVSTPNNMVFVGSNSIGPPIYTKDGGVTWLPVSLPGVEEAGSATVNSNFTITGYSGNANNLQIGETVLNNQGIWSGTNNATVTQINSSTSFNVSQSAVTSGSGVLLQFTNYSGSFLSNQKTVCADRVNANTFYIYNGPYGQIFTSSNSGDTWTNQNNTSLQGSPYFVNATGAFALKCVPGHAGHLFLAPGGTSGNHFARSTDGGATWSSVTGITNVQAFGFGAVKPGSSYPSIFVFGVLNGTTLGIFRSDDNAATWNQLGGAGEYNPVYSIQQITDIEGDKTVFGKVYGSFSGNSFFCGALSPGC